MKNLKKFFFAAVMCFAVGFIFNNTVTVFAADKVPGQIYIGGYYDVKDNYKSMLKYRVTVDNSSGFRVDYADGDSIAKVKVNKKGLTTAVTEYYKGTNNNSYSYISFHGDKAGTYKLTITINDATGKKKATKKVTVQVVNNNSILKKATFGSQVVVSNETTMKSGTKKTVQKYNAKVKGASGSIKLTSNSQYKITGLIVVAVDANGKYTYKKVKNGGKITLSKGYESKSTSANGYNYRSDRKYTYIMASYKDKFFGDTVKYTITSKRGRKEVKCVEYDKATGRKSVYYSQYPSSIVTLWQY